MFVRLSNGNHICVTNEHDVADIVEKYCGSELAALIRDSEYTKLVENCIEANNTLAKIETDYGIPGEIYSGIEAAMLLLEEVI